MRRPWVVNDPASASRVADYFATRSEAIRAARAELQRDRMRQHSVYPPALYVVDLDELEAGARVTLDDVQDTYIGFDGKVIRG